MHYRLVAIDLDGTLLDSAKRIPADNLSAIEEISGAGIAVAVVSGRRFSSLRRLLAPLQPAYVVANSGAIVREGLEGAILRRRMLPRAAACEILRFAREFPMEPVVHDGPNGEGHIILRSSARDLPSLKRYLGERQPNAQWVDDFRLLRDPVQIGFTDGVDSIRAFEKALRHALAPRGLGFATARTEYADEDFALLDVLSEEATKAVALEFLASHLGITLEETIAIGDNWNDVEMLERAGLGIVMGNASSALRAHGLATTSTNDDAGVAEAIRRYVLS
ncbi:MAG TPA: HAD family hydrolase [Vicinamibacteria bacterium]|nr:HAD family hydrolase [Vicinamibacteria bacterium]